MLQVALGAEIVPAMSESGLLVVAEPVLRADDAPARRPSRSPQAQAECRLTTAHKHVAQLCRCSLGFPTNARLVTASRKWRHFCACLNSSCPRRLLPEAVPDAPSRARQKDGLPNARLPDRTKWSFGSKWGDPEILGLTTGAVNGASLVQLVFFCANAASVSLIARNVRSRFP
jgi:hypothetical protein